MAKQFAIVNVGNEFVRALIGEEKMVTNEEKNAYKTLNEIEEKPKCPNCDREIDRLVCYDTKRTSFFIENGHGKYTSEEGYELRYLCPICNVFVTDEEDYAMEVLGVENDTQQ